MRLVIRHPAARQVFEINGIDTVISVYPDLPAALEAAPRRLASHTLVPARRRAADGPGRE